MSKAMQHVSPSYTSQWTGKLVPQLSKATGSQGLELSRLFISDKGTATQFLIDTGADVSVVPPTHSEKKSPNKLELFAANGTRIQTYGHDS